MKITFDSNVWRKVASPNNFPKDPIIGDYKKIREGINCGKIQAFLSETIFTLEAINKKDRKKFFKDYKANINTEVSEGENGEIKISFSIGPNPDAHPGNNEFLREHLSDAVKLGFNIINLPRIGGVTNKDIEDLRYKISEFELDKGFKVADKIKKLKAGVYDIQQIGIKYDSNSWFKGIGKAPDTENGIIAVAVAEWADGDSIASHIAIDGDYFCTNDSAKKAGSNSILSDRNVKQLNEEFGLNKISPSELAKLI